MAHMANLAFDASTWEIYGSLLNGGTLICIDAMTVLDPEALLRAFGRHDVRTALITPTLFRQYTLECPALISTLEMLCVGGEALHPRDWESAEHLLTGKLINCYGPTENACISTTFLLTKEERCVNGVPIGRAISNSGAYVMDSRMRLVPLGVIGELVVTGDGLARGYTDPEQNTDRFVSIVVAGQAVKAYRTGDCVRYRPTDGQLETFGRIDGQVKIRGQRIELGEIEHVLRSHESVSDAVAVLQHHDGGEVQLAGFITVDEAAATRPLHSLTSKPLRQQFLQKVQQQLHDKLQAQLPLYMIPQFITVLDVMPINQNGKVDRRVLEQQSQTQTTRREPLQQPISDAERTMQKLWARVLNIEPESIGLDDSFFRLGGDSIAAMKLVGKAREVGLQLAVADVFRQPKLVDLSSSGSYTSYTAEEIPAFSLLGNDIGAAKIREEVAIGCNIDMSLVEDIYPCSPLQEGLISLTSKRAGDYIMQSVLELRDDIDADTLRAAWEHVARSTAILRTRIVHHSKLGLLQAVVAEEIRWEEGEELDEYLVKDKSVSMGLGDSLTRYAIIKGGREGKRWLVWTIHHTLYDGWSIPRIMDAVTETYNGAALEKPPNYHAFIKYLGQLDHDATTAYWQTALADCEAPPFPPLPLAVQQPTADTTLELQCPALPKIPSDITKSTLIRAAWAIVSRHHIGSEDVVFGATVTGRNAPVAGIEAMIGPTIATVPVRICVHRDQTVSAFLAGIQRQATEMIPYEQTGLQRISKVTAGARHACSFQTLLVVQPASEEIKKDGDLGEWRSRSDLQDFTTYGLVIQCTLARTAMSITASFDRRIIKNWLVQSLLNQLSFVMRQLARADSQVKVADIDTLTPEDKGKIWAWNRETPAAMERCIHDLFAEQAGARPDAPAICAWDGEMTYGELDELSAKLAGHLVEIGVKPDDIVPLCFEKSLWTIVAMLAVLKAGGAFLLLDPCLPRKRLQLMCNRVASTLALSSHDCVPVIQSLIETGSAIRTVIPITRATILQIPQHASSTTTVRPTDTAYVIFTSGSTGAPKGCRIEHRSACSAILGHGCRVGMHANTRTLQFGSYAFAGSLVEILLTLAHGGCVCVPSEDERIGGLAPAISRMRVNWAFLTSTVLDLLRPEAVPSLTTLCVGGEPIQISQVAEWAGQVHLRQTYGSSEMSGIISSERLTSSSMTRDVGKAGTGIYWIVDPSDHHRLVPIGAIGEL
ncbi:hypothetical protein QBC35DRAFT_550140, partial [Podospora australis]